LQNRIRQRGKRNGLRVLRILLDASGSKEQSDPQSFSPASLNDPSQRRMDVRPAEGDIINKFQLTYDR